MGKIIKNSVRGQVSDYLARHAAFKGLSYKLAITEKEVLSIKTVTSEKLAAMVGDHWTPAAVRGDTVYVSEVFHEGANQCLKEFIIAHEVGHWVVDEYISHPRDSVDYFMESEIGADRIAMAIYPENKYKEAARQSLLELIVEGSHLMTSFSPDRLEVMSARLRVLATRLMHLK